MIAEVSVNSEGNVILVQDPAQIELATYGIQGPRGNAFLSGSGVPAPTLGINLDLYVNLNNGYVYKKLSGIWTYQTYITPQQKKVTISAQNIVDKFITLSPVPARPNDVTLEFLTGGGQENGVEFEVVGDKLLWAVNPVSGVIGMEGLIAENDVIIVRY